MTTVLTSFTTEWHACSIETIPFQSTNDRCFLLGTYELDSKSTDNEISSGRSGNISLLQQKSDADLVEVDCHKIKSGVLDMKFASPSLFASAMSDGRVDLFHISSDYNILWKHSTGESSDILYLSLDWNVICEDIPMDAKLSVSTQNGSVLVFQVTPSGASLINSIDNAHPMFGQDMPVWIVAHSKQSQDVLLSGGDDYKFKLWDIRSPLTPLFTSKFHSYGVTSAMWHPKNSNIFVTGSYDEHCAVWDQRRLDRPVLDIATGGGVWRTKWFCAETESSADFLITANMQGGARIYNLSNPSELICTVKKTVEFGDSSNSSQLMYGIDLLRHKNSSNSSAHQFDVASCSFYENLVQIWRSEL